MPNITASSSSDPTNDFESTNLNSRYVKVSENEKTERDCTMFRHSIFHEDHVPNIFRLRPES